MDVRLLIEQMLAEVAEAEGAIQKKREVIQFLKDRVQAEAQPPHTLRAMGIPSGEAFGTPVLRRRIKSFSGRVAAVVRGLSGEEFDVAEIHEHLAKVMGGALPADPRTRISTVLGRMVDAGEIVKTHTGAGSNPHKYKVADGKSIGSHDEDEEGG